MNKKIIKILSLALIGLVYCTTLVAQPDAKSAQPETKDNNAGRPPGPPDPPDDNPVPITGIEYLIAAGAAFGAKKLYDKKKSN